MTTDEEFADIRRRFRRRKDIFFIALAVVYAALAWDVLQLYQSRTQGELLLWGFAALVNIATMFFFWRGNYTEMKILERIIEKHADLLKLFKERTENAWQIEHRDD